MGDHEASDGESAISDREPEKSTLKWRVMVPFERWVGTEKLFSIRVSALVSIASTLAAASTAAALGRVERVDIVGFTITGLTLINHSIIYSFKKKLHKIC